MEAYIGEIRMFAGIYAPKGWAFCDGQLLSVRDYTALYSLFGTTYGGNGIENFALPDLRGRVPVHTKEHNYDMMATPYSLGAHGGAEMVSLLPSQMPQHTHQLMAAKGESNTSQPEWHVLAKSAGGNIYSDGVPAVPMNNGAVSPAGESFPHDNMPPYLAINFIIALEGEYPVRQ